MANYFVGNKDQWLSLSDAEADFTTLFVRSWIPFNAWYCNTYSTTKDRVCIDMVKTDGNAFRARLLAHLNGDDDESKSFKFQLASLHNRLQRFPIPDANPYNRISFENIYFRTNPKTVTTPPLIKRGLEYKTELLTNRNVSAKIVNTKVNPAQTLYSYTHTKYQIQNFEQDLTRSTIKEEQKRHLKQCFLEINPKRKESVISSSRRNSLKIGTVHFVEDNDLVSQAVIEILYGLRCKLFHGELQPTRDNLSIYEPAFFLLRILLKSLR